MPELQEPKESGVFKAFRPSRAFQSGLSPITLWELPRPGAQQKGPD
jgi:hypothetical protein